MGDYYTMRRILFFLCIITVFSFSPDSSVFFLESAQAAPEKDFNIALITIDTLRADHLSCYGYKRETSPNIDKIAEEGLRFNNVIAPSSWTAPSMVSLFTSTYPINHGVVYGLQWKRHKKYSQDVFSEELTTLPEVLNTLGYTTFGVSSNHNLTADLGFARGFHYFKYAGNANSADGVNEIVWSWEDKIKGAKKFFLWVHYMDPHHPYHDRFPWIAQYTSPSLTRALNFTDKTAKELNRNRSTLKNNPEHLSNLIALYDSEINYVDSHVGQLIQKFGLGKNTLLIITSDHGEEFLEHGIIGHAQNLHRETIQVPLIIKPPYSSEKKVINEPTNLIDVVPTILDILDVEPPAHALGKSALKKDGLSLFLKKMFMRSKECKYDFAELDRVLNLKAVISPQWKYIYDYTNETEQLYNIKSDPGELTNLADKNLNKCKKLKEDLLSWVSGAKKYSSAKQQVQLSEEQEEKLQALGYLTKEKPQKARSRKDPVTNDMKEATEKKREQLKAVADQDAALTIVNPSSTGLSINLKNKTPVGGIQFTISGVKIVEILTTSRTSGFVITFNDKTGTVIMIGASDRTIDEGEGVIAHIACQEAQEAHLSEIKISR